MWLRHVVSTGVATPHRAVDVRAVRQCNTLVGQAGGVGAGGAGPGERWISLFDLFRWLGDSYTETEIRNFFDKVPQPLQPATGF
jgi:hypothetical protein